MAAGRFELREDSPGDAASAAFLCEASALAYLPEAEGTRAFAETLGLDARLFSADNTQAWLGTNDEHIVVAFRGTESPTGLDGLKDILLTDAANFTEDEWDIVAQTPDAERHNVVAQLLRETSGQDALPFDDGQDS